MYNLTLTVLAAGMGSRFGGRLKQLEPLGPSGELLIDYSVHDAVRAGFDRVVFIIREDIEELFKSTIGSRVEKLVKTEYVFQSPERLPCRVHDFPSRTKPWGTAQALYCCGELLDGPFAVINSDDFYSLDAFVKLSEFLKNFTADACSVDFLLKNTLSEYGAVNRGICKTDSGGFLASVEETKQILRGADGVIRGKYDGYDRILDEDSVTSMSMWGFGADFMNILERRLADFLNNLQPDELKSELTIADAVGKEIVSRGFKVRDIPTEGKWFGLTYESDVEKARKTLSDYVARGVYASPLN